MAVKIRTQRTTTRHWRTNGTWAVYVKTTRGSGTTIYDNQADAEAHAEAMSHGLGVRDICILHP